MISLTPDLRQRFHQLLLQLPNWELEEGRRLLVGQMLRGHPIWDSLDLTGAKDVAADRLLDLFAVHGPDPYLALLGGLGQLQQANPVASKEIASLATALRAIRPPRPRQVWKDAPYRGLAYFDRRHAPIFFGREAEVDQLFQTITGTEQGRRFSVVVGASGSGKSSLVRAGLWPLLAETKHWFVSAMTPLEMSTPAESLRAAFVQACKEHDGFEDKRDLAAQLDEKPLAEVAARLLPADGRWLLILDQMEELFAPGIKEEGALFLDRLLEATKPQADGTPSRFQVLATLRADFFHYCLEHPPLMRAVSREGGQLLLSAPNRLSLERMVTGPLAEVDLPVAWTLDPSLAPTIAADAERHPGGLALMAFTLRELYDTCVKKRRLDTGTYRGEAFGGLSGAIARRADQTLRDLGEGSEKTLERVFARLVRVTKDDAPTRRREPLAVWDDDPAARKLVDAFQKARLLVFDAGATVEVAHEALLREWPRLTEWIEKRRDAFGLAERVRTEAHAWMNGPASRHHRRPWDTDQIEEFRERLRQAGLLDALLDDPHVARLLTPERDWMLMELQFEATPHYRRAQIGRRLNELGDSRPGVGVIDGVPDILWCSIPAGRVDVMMRGWFSVEPFQMSAYPVTGAQFRAFLEAADGFRNQNLWKDLDRRAPREEWKDLLENHPATFVSWFDATAYCRWLTVRLDFEVRLPDEQEWQWAAQSADELFVYPWGQEWREGVANTKEAHIGGTIAVGSYPDGDSLQGVSDLAGNVVEWCRNAKDELGTEHRASCGGSWDNERHGAQAASSGITPRGFRNLSMGFRVVRAEAPSTGR